MLLPQDNTISPAQVAINTILDNNQRIINFNKQQIELQFNAVWGGTDYTAQQVFDILGTDAGALFKGVMTIVSLIQIVEPSYTPPTPPYPVDINSDGTVTVTYPANFDATTNSVTPTP